MKIDHITFSSAGGAGQVARVIAEAETELGVDARLVTVLETGLRESPLKAPLLSAAAFIDEYLVKNSAQEPMFSLFRRRITSVDSAAIRPDSHLHFHWMEGVLSTLDFIRLVASRPRSIWTVHDMAPFTGGCHQSLGCNSFSSSCSSCPMAKPMFQKTIARALESREGFTGLASQLTLVAPSKWMKRQIASSRLFHDFRVEVIENPIDKAFFEPYTKFSIRASLGIDQEAIVVGVVAAQLDNPQKRVKELIRIFFEAASGRNAYFLLIGSGGQSLAKLNERVIYVGAGDSHHVAKHLASANFVVSGSQAESAGMFVREAGALGIPALVTANGGSDEMIDHAKSGMVFASLPELSRGIESIFSGDVSLLSLGSVAQKKSVAQASPRHVSQQYLALHE